MFSLVPSLLLAANLSRSPSPGDPAVRILEGISNRGANPEKPYATAGDRAYLVGAQDGSFPDMGWHSPGEMGGLWLHPIKLIDGFRATVEEGDRKAALSRAIELIAYPYGNRLRYAALDSLEVERFEWSPDGHDGLVVRYDLRNSAARARHLRFVLAVKTDLRPVWFSDRLGIEDAADTVGWEAARGRFIARDASNSWFCVWGAAGAAGAERVEAKPIATAGMGVTAASRHDLVVAPRGAASLTFVFAGSARDEGSARRAWEDIAAHHARLLDEKRRRYAALVDRARTRIADPRLEGVRAWV